MLGTEIAIEIEIAIFFFATKALSRKVIPIESGVNPDRKYIE